MLIRIVDRNAKKHLCVKELSYFRNLKVFQVIIYGMELELEIRHVEKTNLSPGKLFNLFHTREM